MHLTITTHDCLSSEGYASLRNPIAIALGLTHPELEEVKVSYNRVTALKEGYPVRFLIRDFSIHNYRELVHGIIQTHVCRLVPRPVPVTSSTEIPDFGKMYDYDA